MRTIHFVGLLSLCAVACGAPDSFEGITGGDAPPPVSKGVLVRSADPNIVTPRQLSPLSVSMVATKRPRFFWDLGDGIIGAVLELCPTRACNPDDVKRIEVEGKSYTMLDDLEPGFWFWRVYGMSKERVGTVASPTWELVVRGPAKNGESDIPAGSVTDIDGDGRPDFVASGEDYFLEPDMDAAYVPVVQLFFGDKNGELHSRDSGYQFFGAAAGDDAVAPVFSPSIDTDGDGFSDYAEAFLYTDTPDGGGPVWGVDIAFGSGGKSYEVGDGSTITDYLDGAKFANIAMASPLRPTLAIAGDVNGDGYGDVMAASGAFGVFGMGSAKGTAATMSIPSDVGDMEKKVTWPLLGGFGGSADGLSDVAFVSGHLQGPVTVARGDRQRIDEKELTAMPAEAGAEKAMEIASGDFDGDGLMDLAATVPFGNERRICVWVAKKDAAFSLKECIPGPAGDATFGDQLTAADLEGDGQDELLVSMHDSYGAGVGTLHLDGDYLVTDYIDAANGFGNKLTTIWPGRPGRAKWASVSADGRSIAIFEGRKQVQTLRIYLAPDDLKKNGFVPTAAFSYVRSIR